MKTSKKTIRKVSFALLSLFLSMSFIFQDSNVLSKLQAAAIFYPRTSAPSKSDYHYYSDNPFYQSGYGMPNCTAYAWGRAYEILGYKPNLSRSHAYNWFNDNVNKGAFSYGNTPKIGSIICWNGGYGHVAVVEAVNGNTMTISESAYGGFNFRTKTASITEIQKKDPGFQGYIYLGNFTNESIPNAPTLNLSNSGYHYTMSWNDVGASEYIVRIYCADEEMKVINVGRNFSYTIPLLGKNYWAGVSAKNSAGESPLSNLVEMIPNAYNLLGKAQNLGEHFYAQIGFSNNTYLVNVNNNAQLGNINSSNQAIYEFTRTANEAYTIKDMKTGLYLDVYQAASKSATNMQFYSYNPGPAQRFFIRKFNDGYSLQPECAPYMAMNASGGNFESGTNIQIYPIDLTSAHKLYIKKGEIKIPALVKDYNGRYDGKPHSISIANIPSGSQVYYRTNTNSAWSLKKPTRTSAGTTTIYYKITNPLYFQTLSGDAKITIQKNIQKGYAKSYSGTYDGKSHTISFNNVVSGSKIYYRTSTKAKWSTKKVTRTSAGTTTIYYKIVNSNCTNTKTGTVKIVIKKASQKGYAKSYSGTYNGKSHTIRMSNVAAGSKVYYRTNNRAKWSTKKPTRTSVGTTAVYYKIVNSNCTRTKTGSAKITIKKAIQKGKAKGYSGSYNGKAHTISFHDVTAGTKIYYRTSTRASWSMKKPTRTSIGKTTVYYKLSNANCTKTVYGTSSITVKTGMQKPSVKSYTGYYDGKNHSISLSNIAKNSVVYYRTSTKGNWTKTKPYRKSIGITTVYYKITNKNYATVSGSAKIAIEQKVTGIKLNTSLVTLYTPNTYQLKASITPANATNKKVTWTTSNTNIASISSSGIVTAKAAGSATITARASNGKTTKCTIHVNQNNVYIADGTYAFTSPDARYALTAPGSQAFTKLNIQPNGDYNAQYWNLQNIGGNAFILRSQLDNNKVVDIYHIHSDYITAASQYETPPTYYGHVEGHAYLNPYTDPMADEWQAMKLYDGTYVIKLKQYPDFKLTRGGDYDASGNSVYLYHWNAWQQTYWKLIKVF